MILMVYEFVRKQISYSYLYHTNSQVCLSKYNRGSDREREKFFVVLSTQAHLVQAKLPLLGIGLQQLNHQSLQCHISAQPQLFHLFLFVSLDISSQITYFFMSFHVNPLSISLIEFNFLFPHLCPLCDKSYVKFKMIPTADVSPGFMICELLFHQVKSV